MSLSLGRVVVGAGLAVLVACLTPLAAVAGTTETPVPSTSPDADGVVASAVFFDAPLPDELDAPVACDRLSYLRYRESKRTNNPAKADAILVLMPGFLGGAGTMDPLARNIVRRAAEQGYHVEVWPVDRRGNCLEDHTGLKAAVSSDDPDLAADYYLRGRAIDGRTFATPPSSATQILTAFGAEQTLDDWRLVLDRVPVSMRSRTFCGGHSFGGLLTSLLAQWDFDGDSRTKGDQGYKRCAGLVILDSRTELVPQAGGIFRAVGNVTSLLKGVGISDTAALVDSGLPYVPMDKLLSMTAALGSAAAKDPSGRSVNLSDLPKDPASSAVLTLSASDPVAALLGAPRAQDLKATNEAAFGFFLDDNSAGIAWLRASLGGLSGGAVTKKNFPLPYGSPMAPMGALGGATVQPADRKATYSWTNYDDVPRSGLQTQPGRVTYTRPDQEVTDVQQLAKSFALADIDGMEWYYPTRLEVEAFTAIAGDHSGSLGHVVAENLARRPALYLDAEHGVGPNMVAPEMPGRDTTRFTLRGYDHVDTIAAAYHQTSGHPEQASAHTVDFMKKYASKKESR